MKIEFTDHIRNRLKKRKIKEKEIIDAINNPDNEYKSEGKFYAQKDLGRGKIEVVYQRDKYIKLITVYWI